MTTTSTPKNGGTTPNKTTSNDDTKWWQARGNFAQLASAGIAFVAVLAIWVQLNAWSVNARQSSARQIYSTYMDVRYKNNDFIHPIYEEIKSDPLRLAAYKIFINHMIWAYDEMIFATEETWLFGLLKYAAHDPTWAEAFKDELGGHRAYLCDSETKIPFNNFGDSAVSVIKAAIADCAPERPMEKPAQRASKFNIIKNLALYISASFALIAAALWAYASYQKVPYDPEVRTARLIEVDAETNRPLYDILETAKRQTRWNGWAALAASIAAIFQAVSLLL